MVGDILDAISTGFSVPKCQSSKQNLPRQINLFSLNFNVALKANYHMYFNNFAYPYPIMNLLHGQKRNSIFSPSARFIFNLGTAEIFNYLE